VEVISGSLYTFTISSNVFLPTEIPFVVLTSHKGNIFIENILFDLSSNFVYKGIPFLGKRDSVEYLS